MVGWHSTCSTVSELADPACIDMVVKHTARERTARCRRFGVLLRRVSTAWSMTSMAVTASVPIGAHRRPLTWVHGIDGTVECG